MSYHSRKNFGFTLMELLVSITIVSVILSVIIKNQSTYTDGIALTLAADEISLAISQAQAYGIGVRELSPGSNKFSFSYGLSFNILNIPDPGHSQKKSYLFFADQDSNGFYNGDSTCPVGGASECLEKFSISQGNYIYSMCFMTTYGGEDCRVGRVDISFLRPKVETQFVFLDLDGSTLNPSDLKGVRIVLKSPKGAPMSIIIYNTGQISVVASEGPSCSGTYNCGQWTNPSNCENIGVQCSWHRNPKPSRCGPAEDRKCDRLTYLQCVAIPINCVWH